MAASAAGVIGIGSLLAVQRGSVLQEYVPSLYITARGNQIDESDFCEAIRLGREHFTCEVLNPKRKTPISEDTASYAVDIAIRNRRYTTLHALLRRNAGDPLALITASALRDEQAVDMVLEHLDDTDNMQDCHNPTQQLWNFLTNNDAKDDTARARLDNLLCKVIKNGKGPRVYTHQMLDDLIRIKSKNTTPVATKIVLQCMATELNKAEPNIEHLVDQVKTIIAKEPGGNFTPTELHHALYTENTSAALVMMQVDPSLVTAPLSPEAARMFSVAEGIPAFLFAAMLGNATVVSWLAEKTKVFDDMSDTSHQYPSHIAELIATHQRKKKVPVLERIKDALPIYHKLHDAYHERMKREKRFEGIALPVQQMATYDDSAQLDSLPLPFLEKLQTDLSCAIEKYRNYTSQDASCPVCYEEHGNYVITCNGNHKLCVPCYNNPAIHACPLCRAAFPFDKLRSCQSCAQSKDDSAFYYCDYCAEKGCKASAQSMEAPDLTKYVVIMCPSCEVSPCCNRPRQSPMSRDGYRSIYNHIEALERDVEETRDRETHNADEDAGREMGQFVESLNARRKELEDRINTMHMQLVSLKTKMELAKTNLAIAKEQCNELKAKLEKDEFSTRWEFRQAQATFTSEYRRYERIVDEYNELVRQFNSLNSEYNKCVDEKETFPTLLATQRALLSQELNTRVTAITERSRTKSTRLTQMMP